MGERGDLPLLQDPRLTTMGLLLETQSGVRAIVESDLEEHGVTASAFEVLIRLARSPDHGLRMTELAAQSTLSNSGLTRVVDRLGEAGYVDRIQHEQDRRVFHAVITDAGLALLHKVLPSHLATVDEALTGVLDPEELAAFVAALRKIRRVVKPGADPALTART
jgi:DNA-binding MarR family transcriptional regulator